MSSHAPDAATITQRTPAWLAFAFARACLTVKTRRRLSQSTEKSFITFPTEATLHHLGSTVLSAVFLFFSRIISTIFTAGRPSKLICFLGCVDRKLAGIGLGVLAVDLLDFACFLSSLESPCQRQAYKTVKTVN